MNEHAYRPGDKVRWLNFNAKSAGRVSSLEGTVLSATRKMLRVQTTDGIRYVRADRAHRAPAKEARHG